MRTIFRFFRGILRIAWSLFWGFFWTIAISFLVLVGIIYFTDSPSSGMDGVGRAAQKVVYQVGNLFGDQGFASRFGMTPSSQTTQTDNHEHSGARWEKAEATVYLDPNISQTFVKAYRDAIEAWNQTGAFTFKLVTNEKEANVVLTEMDNASVSAAGETAWDECVPEELLWDMPMESELHSMQFLLLLHDATCGNAFGISSP